MDDATRAELEAIKRRVEAATPLPGNNTHRVIYEHGGGRMWVESNGGPILILDSYNRGDTEFYIAALDDAHRLLSIIEEQEREIERQREEIVYAASLANRHAFESNGYMQRWRKAERELEDARRNAFDETAALVPTSWLDSLLTGPDAVLKSKGGTWGYPEIEAVLRGVKQRIEAARDTKSKEAQS